jgi:3-methyladenine DNA glycosylase/8-oxoguanine DNA glycosylase
MRVEPDGVWRATNGPDGPVTMHLTAASGRVTIQAWGPGSGWALEAAPTLVGGADDDSDFLPVDPVVRDLHRRFRGVRMCRSEAVVEAMVPTIIEQKVIGIEAHRSYARLVRRYGQPAPGPAELLLPPTPALLQGTPSWAFHPLGIERKRADAIRRACSYAKRLEEVTDLPREEAYRRLTALPGVGPWSAAEVAARALGDADAVSVGDFHLPHHVTFALSGEARGSDELMLELLEPYLGHRARVIRLIEIGHPAPPRYGPRLPLQHIEAI